MRGLKAQRIGKRSQPLRYHHQDRYQMQRSNLLSQEVDYVGREVDDVGGDSISASSVCGRVRRTWVLGRDHWYLSLRASERLIL